ncbi:hypothetical protein BMG523Draft_04182 [Frankia sp. BMG5.23]|nr:hypothetical protein BMG523Draft_04182 [Frankia sp. BMG5.23]
MVVGRLLGDVDGVHNPAEYNDRVLLVLLGESAACRAHRSLSRRIGQLIRVSTEAGTVQASLIHRIRTTDRAGHSWAPSRWGRGGKHQLLRAASGPVIHLSSGRVEVMIPSAAARPRTTSV